MPSIKDRTCLRCSGVERTASKSPLCKICFIESKKEILIEEERKLLSSLYDGVEGPVVGDHDKRVWTFTHECGTRQSWVMGNVRKQLKARPDKIPCSKCGGKERMAKAMEAYIEEYGRDFDVALWEEYKVAARRMTERTYKANEHEINPLNLKRGVRTWHLDHKMPIIEGFLQGIPVEVIAAKENLQILPAFTNMSKGRKHESNT